jgi:hypothetical protein
MKLKYALLLLFLLVALIGLNYLHSITQNSTKNSLASLNNIKSRLQTEAPKMQAAFPEGAFLSYAFYGTAWVNIGLISDDPLIKQQAIKEATWTYKELGSHTLADQFAQLGPLDHGVFYTGWRNRLLGGILLLQSTQNPELEKEFHTQSALLTKAFTDSPQPILPSYPERAWPSDNIPALASLRIHDKLYQSTYTDDVIKPWINQVSDQYSLDTNLFPHQLDGTTGKVTKTTRGASSAYLLSFLPEVDQDFATEQYKLYTTMFVRKIGPISGTQEYPKGVSVKRNTNSGPILAGFGATASVFNIAANRTNNDYAQAKRNSYFFSLIGIPQKTAQHRSYLLGKFLVYDTALTWSSTHINWVTIDREM